LLAPHLAAALLATSQGRLLAKEGLTLAKRRTRCACR
jgi:hypothetical protein